jgi:hypothetical protein
LCMSEMIVWSWQGRHFSSAPWEKSSCARSTQIEIEK